MFLVERGLVGYERLLQQVLSITKASRRGPCDQPQGIRRGLGPFVHTKLGESINDRLRRDPPEIEPLAPGYDGQGHLVDFRRTEDKYHVLWRLLERLKERIEGRLGKHVHFVYDVDLISSFAGGEMDLFPEVSDIVDASIAGGVDLDQVEGSSLIDRHTYLALIVGLAVLRRQAGGGLRQDPGRAGLAGTSGTAKQVGVGHSSLRDGVAQGLHNGLLPDHLVEPSWTPLPVEYLAHSRNLVNPVCGFSRCFPESRLGTKSLH